MIRSQDMGDRENDMKPPSFDGKGVSKFLRDYEAYVEDQFLLKTMGKEMTDEVFEKTLKKQKVLLLKNRVTDSAYRNEVVSHTSYKGNDWEKLKTWMLSRWESQDITVKESDLRDLLKQQLSPEDFVSKFTNMVGDMHEMDKPQGRVLTDMFTRGIGKDHTLTVLSEMTKRDAAAAADGTKYLRNGYPISWEKCKEVLDALGYYHSQGLPVLHQQTASNPSTPGMENLISQMEQLQIKLSKLEKKPDREREPFKRPCLFCDKDDCAGAKAKRDCPFLKPYLENGSITFTDRGFFADKEGKALPLRVRQGGIRGELERPKITPSSKHIKVIPEIPSADSMVSKTIVEEEEKVKQLLGVIADSSP